MAGESDGQILFVHRLLLQWRVIKDRHKVCPDTQKDNRRSEWLVYKKTLNTFIYY